MAEPVEATTQINPFGKNILKHTLHQFASEFQLCSLNNIALKLKSLRLKKIHKKPHHKKRLTKISKPFVVKNLCNNYCGKITPSTTCTIPLDAGTVAIILTVPLMVGLPFTILIVIFLPSTMPND